MFSSQLTGTFNISASANSTHTASYNTPTRTQRMYCRTIIPAKNNQLTSLVYLPDRRSGLRRDCQLKLFQPPSGKVRLL